MFTDKMSGEGLSCISHGGRGRGEGGGATREGVVGRRKRGGGSAPTINFAFPSICSLPSLYQELHGRPVLINNVV